MPEQIPVTSLAESVPTPSAETEVVVAPVEVATQPEVQGSSAEAVSGAQPASEVVAPHDGMPEAPLGDEEHLLELRGAMSDDDLARSAEALAKARAA